MEVGGEGDLTSGSRSGFIPAWLDILARLNRLNLSWLDSHSENNIFKNTYFSGYFSSRRDL